ncbi:MAG: CaiB/BaiF CoA transferase family protein [Hyphomicrobiaceae bacterium]
MTVEVDFQPESKSSLSGLRVLDLSRLVSGNIVTHLLGDHGAEVIKVERPGVGDDLRNWKTKGHSVHWKVYCRNKKSITLDLRPDEGKAIFLDLVQRMNVLVENFKPGTLEKWGIGPDVLLDRNPRLVIVRVSGWGQTGLYAHKPGFGSLVEAMSGFAAMNGFADRPPVLPPLALADMIAGLYGSFAVLAAMRSVDFGDGKGQVIDLPLFDPIYSILGPIAAQYRLTGEIPERTGSRSNQTAPRNTYRTRDGKYVALSASMQAMAERFFRAIGMPELLDDPKYTTNTDRVANNDELDPIVGDFMASRTQAELLELFEKADITVGTVVDISQLMDHPYINDRAVIVDVPDADLGRLPMHNVIPRMSGTPATLRSPAPDLGQHNNEIYSEIGLKKDDLDRLGEQGII